MNQYKYTNTIQQTSPPLVGYTSLFTKNHTYNMKDADKTLPCLVKTNTCCKEIVLTVLLYKTRIWYRHVLFQSLGSRSYINIRSSVYIRIV